MKFSELKNFVDSFSKNDCRAKIDPELVISISRPSVGPTASCGIDSIGSGCDWNAGKIIFRPAKQLVEKPDSMALHDMASDFIFSLAREGAKMKRPSWPYREAIHIIEKKHPNWRERFSGLLKD